MIAPRAMGIAAAALLVCTACGPNVVRKEIFASEDRDVIVSLRHVVEGSEPVSREFAHPVTISDVRVAHILAQIQYRDDDDKNQAAIRNRHIYPLATGLSKALAQASADDEVIAEVYHVDRRFGIFTIEKVTALRVFFEHDFMLVQFFAISEKLEKAQAERGKPKYDVPLHPPEKGLFKIVPSIKQTAYGPRGVSVDWRDPYFAKPVSSVSGGSLRRRTILLEEEAEDQSPTVPGPAFSEKLRDAQLDALDALDQERRSGSLTETEFQRRRRLVLEGRLAEAGFDASEPSEQ